MATVSGRRSRQTRMATPDAMLTRDSMSTIKSMGTALLSGSLATFMWGATLMMRGKAMV